MKTISLSQGKSTIVDDDDFDRLVGLKWYCANGYAVRHLENPKRLIQGMHRFIMDAPEGMEVDHINGDPLDNRRCNLRLATAQQNCFNQRIAKNNTSGFKGVGWHKRIQKWQASIRVDGRLKSLGYFTCPKEAYEAYKEAARYFFKEFARI